MISIYNMFYFQNLSFLFFGVFLAGDLLCLQNFSGKYKNRDNNEKLEKNILIDFIEK